MNKIVIKNWDELEDREPSYALVADVDLVVVRFDDAVSVLYGRCAHRGALMSDGSVDGGCPNSAPGLRMGRSLLTKTKSLIGLIITHNHMIVTPTRATTRTQPVQSMNLMSN